MTYVTFSNLAFSPQGCWENDFIPAFLSVALCHSSDQDNPYFYTQKNKESAVSHVLKGALPTCNMPQNLGGIWTFCNGRGVRQSPALHEGLWTGVVLLPKAGLPQQKEGLQAVWMQPYLTQLKHFTFTWGKITHHITLLDAPGFFIIQCLLYAQTAKISNTNLKAPLAGSCWSDRKSKLYWVLFCTLSHCTLWK